jgi:predicted permease
MAGFLIDVRFGLRALVANPVFVVLAVLCLAIGIGASTMTFTVVNAALVRPLGSLDAERFVAVGDVHRTSPNQWSFVSLANFSDWRVVLDGRADLAALRGASFALGPSGGDSRADGAFATGNFFAVLGVAPLLGRALEARDEEASSAPVVVLSETYWRRQLDADRGVVGRALTIDGTSHTIVGVVPALLDVGMPNAVRSARIWVPLQPGSQPLARGDRSLFVIARLAAGVGAESFTAQLESVASELAATHPENAGWGVRVLPLADNAVSDLRSTLLLSFGAAALVLVVACANLANLTLAHALRRRHEFGIRAAIGASPWRLTRQLLLEGLIVAVLGALLGLLLARAGVDMLVRFYETNTLAPAVLPIDAVSVAFTVALTVATAALLGFVSALGVARGATRAQIAEAAPGTTMTRGRRAWRRGLMVGQVGGSFVLLIGAVLLSRSFLNLLAVDGGVETRRVTSIRIETQSTAGDTADAASYVDRVLDALAGIPGAEAVAATSNLLPLRGGGFRSAVSLPGDAPDTTARSVAAYTGVTPSFFAALGVPLLQGRSFESGEQSGRVAVVNESLAKLLWGNDSPLGRQFRLDADPERGPLTVVGVVRDIVTWDSNGREPLPAAYLDVASIDSRPIFFFVRSRAAGPVIGAETLTRAVQSLEFSFRRILVTPMQQVARDPFWRQQLFSQWFAVFGMAAVTLAVAGIYGVLGYLVGQRCREIGIRMALGAGRRSVLWLVLREGVAVAGAGVIVGLGVAYWLARALEGLLFGVEALDWRSFAAAAAFLAIVATAASLAPAVRAARIDPSALLRA